jgi:hypothetical protein
VSGRVTLVFASELLARAVGNVVVVALRAARRALAEAGSVRGDLVADAVARETACRVLPPVGGRWGCGSLAQRIAHPSGLPLQLAVGELVAQLGVLARERVDRARQPVAFLARGGRIAEPPCERAAPGQDALQLGLGCR